MFLGPLTGIKNLNSPILDDHVAVEVYSFFFAPCGRQILRNINLQSGMSSQKVITVIISPLPFNLRNHFVIISSPKLPHIDYLISGQPHINHVFVQGFIR